jgi:hypothetical protein
MQNSPSVNFAVYFFEGSGRFEYVYASTGSGGAFAGGASATVGVQAATTGSVYTQFSFNTASLSSGLRIQADRPSTCSSGFGSCVTTSAPAYISGRVLDQDGRPVRSARITLTSVDGRRKEAVTNTFGSFNFSELSAGATYTLSARSRTLRFLPKVITLHESVDNLVITPDLQ